jgi:iron complex transport system permease protein
MKITLDITDLVERGELTASEAERLKGLAAKGSGALGSNIFLSFGAVAIALGVGLFFPHPASAVVVGLLFFGAGFALRLARAQTWFVLAQSLMTIGAIAVAAGVWVITLGAVEALIGLTIAFALAAVAARSGLLAALAVLTLASALGSGTAYWFATYGVWVTRPALSIIVLGLVTLALHLVSLRLPAGYERLAIVGERTAILLMNVAFLVGSLFGDEEFNLDRMVFIIGWALALIAVGVWAIRANRRWVVNTAAVFGALHFYTQWFERLGVDPLSVVGGGLLLIGFGVALRWFNRLPAAASAG